MRNAAANLKKGGYFFGTTCWSEELVRRYREAKKKGSSEFGNSIYSITFPDACPDPPAIFNATYHFKLEEQVNIEEFLVYFPVLKDICEQNGLKRELLLICCLNSFFAIIITVVNKYSNYSSCPKST